MLTFQDWNSSSRLFSGAFWAIEIPIFPTNKRLKKPGNVPLSWERLEYTKEVVLTHLIRVEVRSR